jgi:hypothetical protein
MLKIQLPIDKVYKLKIGTPLSYTLASRNHPRFPLMWYDEKIMLIGHLDIQQIKSHHLRMSKMEMQL